MKKYTTTPTVSSYQSNSKHPLEQKQEIVEAANPNLKIDLSFSCPICMNKEESTCTMCNNNKTLDNSKSFQSFVGTIVDFKMGRSQVIKQEFSPKQYKREVQESALTSATLRDIPLKKQYPDLWNGSCEEELSISYKSSMKLSQRTVIHSGIQCDECHKLPIVGMRHKCKQCQDYDLCSKCYQITKHQHKTFDTIMQSKRNHQKERLRGAVQNEAASDCLKLGGMLDRMHKFFR